MLSLPDVKMCLSSRPWQPFRDAFSKPKEQTVRLQDLTRGDIRSYVTDRFLTDQSFRAMVTHNPQYRDFIDEVVNRTEGVFLWVFLVVKSLLDGIREKDLIPGLRDRLDRLPPNLEDLLEVSAAYGRDCRAFFRYKVVFLHRTVRDFLIANLQEIFGE